jgi:Domain of unknown function (DUF5655)
MLAARALVHVSPSASAPARGRQVHRPSRGGRISFPGDADVGVPRCGRTFANRNQSHACAPLGDLDRHFALASPAVRAAFDRVLAAVSGFGPVTVLPEKTRIALQVRMSFAAFMPRRNWLGGHLVLARRIDSPRFLRVDTYSPRNVVHVFRLTSPAEVDDEFVAWLAEAYQVGAQRHRRG